MTARIERGVRRAGDKIAGQDSRDSTARTGKSGQDGQKITAWTEQSGLDH